MRKLFSVSFMGLVAMIFMVPAGVSSCKKEKIVRVTDTVRVKDTIYVSKDTAMTVQRLTANQWKLKEIRGVAGGSKVIYVRGATTGNTGNYDNETISFNANNTGVYTDPNGYTSSMTWNFASNDNSRLIFTINFPTAVTTITWENLTYRNGAMYYSEHYSQGSFNSHSQGVRIPK